MAEKEHSRLGFKRAIASIVFLGAVATAGDHFNIISRVADPVRYFRRPAAEGFYKDYRNLEKKVIFNDEGDVEVYIGNKKTGEYLPVRENMHAGRTFVDDITDVIEHAKREYRELEEKVKALIERMLTNSAGDKYETD